VPPLMYLMQLIQARNIERTKQRYQVSRRYKKRRLQFCTQACSSVHIFMNVTQPDGHSNKTVAYQIRNKARFCLVWKPQQYSCYILFILSPFGIPLSSNTHYRNNVQDSCHVWPIFFRTLQSLYIISVHPLHLHTLRLTPTLLIDFPTDTCPHIPIGGQPYHSPCVVNNVIQTIPPHTTVTLLATFHVLNSL